MSCAKFSPGAQQGLLHQVFGVLQGSQHAVAMYLKFVAIRFDQFFKVMLVAAASAVEVGSFSRIGHL